MQLAPGTYREPVQLISGVTFIGAGVEQTLVSGEAAWGMALRPFIDYYERRGVPEGMWAVALRDIAMEGFMVDAGERYPVRDARDVAAAMAMVMAVDRDDPSAVATLLERDPSLAKTRIYSPDAFQSGSTLLHSVVTVYTDASDAEYEIARLLIEHGADVNAIGGQARGVGRSALGYAGYFGNPRLVELYLAYGGIPNEEVMFGTAREGSQERNKPTYIPALEMLIGAGGRYDLGHLVMLGHTRRLSADLDADPALADAIIPLRRDLGVDGTPLHESAIGCDVGVASLLLEHGADVNATDSNGASVLERAIWEGCDGDFVRFLLERGAEVDLLSAVVADDASRVKALLAEEPDRIHRRRRDGWSALDLAVQHDHTEIAAVLRAAGATLSQNVEALRDAVGPDHHSRAVLAQIQSTHGEQGYIHLEPTPSLDMGEQITLAAWVYRVARGRGTIIGKWRQLDETWSYVLHNPRSGGFHLHWADGSQDNLTGFVLPYLEWTHYAATYDARHMRVYVNGELVAERAVEGKQINSTGNPVWIGSSGYDNHTPGLIDDVQIWTVARTQDEIRQSMQEGLRGDERGLVGWWPMDGDALKDRSPHGNHGRLEGSAIIHAQNIPSDDRHQPDQVLWLLPLAP